MGVMFLALCVTWMMLTRTVGTRVVPVVKGLMEEEAVRLIEDADLEPAVERNYRKVDLAGTVYEQLPSPNAKVREGRKVKLLVSLGPARAIMPDLRGLSLTEAKNRLRAVGSEYGEGRVRGGLTLDMISRTSHLSQPLDHVISHFPPAGQEVIIGDKVQLLVSTGPPKASVVVPNVAGMTQVEAESKLSEVGLVVQRVSKELSSGEPDRVLRITPSAGTPLTAGDWVSLAISVSRLPRSSGKPRVILIRYVVPLILESKSFQLALTDREGTRNVYSGTPNPGQILEFAERAIGEAELKIYVDGILSKTITYRAP